MVDHHQPAAAVRESAVMAPETNIQMTYLFKSQGSVLIAENYGINLNRTGELNA